MFSVPTLEPLRRFFRRMLPRRAYKFFAAAYDCFELIRMQEYGLMKAYFASKPAGTYQVYCRRLNRFVLLRGESPDLSCFIQNVIREEYGFCRNLKHPKSIIDAGGYIGDTALYFSRVCPEANIYVLEPEVDNYKLCLRNIEGIGSVKAVNAGLGAEEGFLDVTGSFWSAKSTRASDAFGTIRLLTLDKFMQIHDIRSLDLLKLDIEGAEAEVLNDRQALWPSKTRMVLVETHGAECEKAVRDFSSHHGFELTNFRSIKILVRKPAASIKD